MKRFSLLFIAAAAAVLCISSCAKTYTVKDADDVSAFLAGCGIEVTGDCTVKTVTVPAEFGEVYERYNELQKEQGFDLHKYRSREAEVYTFSVISVDGAHTDSTEAHVMVCDNIVIGGDISGVGLNGEMAPIISN